MEVSGDHVSFRRPGWITRASLEGRVDQSGSVVRSMGILFFFSQRTPYHIVVTYSTSPDFSAVAHDRNILIHNVAFRMQPELAHPRGVAQCLFVLDAC